MISKEIKRITDHYASRRSMNNRFYNRLNEVVNLRFQERQRCILKFFKKNKVDNLKNKKILEVGCGSGSNILELLMLGASPQNLVGNELLPDRYAAAKTRLPADVTLIQGNAVDLNFPGESFDIILQSVVFSSILDTQLQNELSKKMWEYLKPNGAVLWYDFIFNNPSNSNVQGVPLFKIKELFPNAKIDFMKVSLAPPIARRIHPLFYPFFNVSLLRTHLVCWIKKL